MPLTTNDYRVLFVDESKLLSGEAFDKVASSAKQTERPLDQLLCEATFITPEQYLQLLANHFNVDSAELAIGDIDRELVQRLPVDFAVQNQVLAFAKLDDGLQVAMVNPGDAHVKTMIEQLLGVPFVPVVTSELAMRRALVLYDGDLPERAWRLVDKLQKAASNAERQTIQAAAVEPMVENIIETAVLMAASDVHLEPYEDELLVRFRIDGLLRTIVSLPIALTNAVTSIIKVEASLRMDQKRLPQDGRFTSIIKGQQVNIRVSTVPSMWGEKVVLRILPKETHLFSVANLGMLSHDLEIIKTELQKPHGMILVTGPTNSGKSTTLYAFLQQIGLERIDVVNISTVEDPIEYTMPRITQIQIDPSIDLTFASGLRALLRQDPDILMVGEIRDSETAQFAIQAALVGRLVLSSLHTNDAPATIPRLLDMGAEPYLVASTVSLIVAQRLARKLCDHCRESYIVDEALLNELRAEHDIDRALHILQREEIISSTDASGLRFYRAVGCTHCDNTGFRGRIGLFEIVQINPEIQTAINERQDSDRIRAIALDGGMKTMFEDGLAKIVLGQLDLAELLRVVYA